ncbi:pathogenesis-related protein 1B-like [Rhodamnia argentea]|uniref:Pathogenesis-related protein 1B-like n=1 Tax=Rhodamnia argentea TaxID=178133 RepID=A0ABM3HG76_9MYRT|nr:pathogenesis-related protein 1B-like [Rhodamnia argentea]
MATTCLLRSTNPNLDEDLEWSGWASRHGGLTSRSEGESSISRGLPEPQRSSRPRGPLRGHRRSAEGDIAGGKAVTYYCELNSHNDARNQVGVMNVTKENTVAAYAQSYANQWAGNCSPVHSNGPYGENLAKGTGTFMGTYTPTNCGSNSRINITTRYYNYNANTYASGRDCLHYTQIVWHELVRVGARVKCVVCCVAITTL